MRLMFVADGRSPTALNWITYFTGKGHEIHLVSTYPCKPNLQLASLHILPVAFSGRISTTDKKETLPQGGITQRVAGPKIRTAIRQWFGPLTLPKAARRLTDIIHHTQPDLIHAMRIPYEGMLAALATGNKSTSGSPPLLISVWGNDFTLHARSTPLMAYFTQLALRRTHALHTDCQRDLRLAHNWGFTAAKPHIVLPGGGGVQTDIFYPPKGSRTLPNFVINPRGFRAYVRNDTYFKAIPLVLEKHPETRFLCPAMEGKPTAHHWLRTLNLAHAVRLLPQVPRPQMAELFRQSLIALSPTTHDGTPNSLLEAMACGCLPIASDLESIREWITHGENGLLFDPTDPHSLARAILQGLEDNELRENACKHNRPLIAERADYQKVMPEAEKFYQQVIEL